MISENYYNNLFIGDVNNNGKPEIMIHSHKPSSGTWRDDIWIIKATGDNQYQVIWYDSIPYNPAYPDYGARSSAGDVTGDGIPEIILSTTKKVYIIQYIPGQGYTYIWQKIYLPADNISTTVYDINNNSINDVVLSVLLSEENPITEIYEYTPEVKEKEISLIYPDFGVFPLIVSDSVQILYNINIPQRIDFYIFNVSGEKIYHKKLKSLRGKNFFYLDLRRLNIFSGIYFLKLEAKNFEKTKKIILKL